jgi:hypothetical protein
MLLFSKPVTVWPHTGDQPVLSPGWAFVPGAGWILKKQPA